MSNKAGFIKEEFIDFIEDAGNLLGDVLLRRVNLKRLGYPRTTFYFRLRKFERQGLIKRQDRNRYGSAFALTEKGKALIKKSAIRRKRTDGLSTIILFDIPEQKHRERNIFRRYLTRNGYMQFQKSALISPLEVSSELFELLDELKIKAYVKIVSGKINF